MQNDPQDLDLMFEYAGVSARLEDYEAAISTLERMLIFNRDLSRVRLELGALYFNIGSYALSERYFRSAIGTPDVPEPVVRRVNRYLAEIDSRTRRHRFSGRLEAGLIYDTNANLGPEDSDVLLFGQPAVLTAESVGEEDFGGRIYATLRHDYDPGGAGNDFWRSEASFFGRRYSDEDDGAVDSLSIRTGPELALGDRLYAPRLRPFIDFSYVLASEDQLYYGGGLGLEFGQSLSDTLSTFGAVRAGMRDYFDPRDDEDGFELALSGGLAWSPRRDLVLTASLLANTDRAKTDHESNSNVTLRLTGSFDYDPGLGFVDKKWRLSGYASAGMTWFDAANPVVTADETRRDTEFRAGIEHTFYLRDGFYTALGASALLRESNISNFDLDNIGISAVVGYEF